MRAKKMTDHTSTIEGAVSDAMSIFQELRDEMTEWADNMSSNNMEHLPKFEEVNDCKDTLDAFADNEPSMPGDLPKGLVDEVKWQTHDKRRQSRADRLAEGTIMLDVVIDHLNTFLDEANDAEDEDIFGETSRDDWENYRDEIDEIKSEAENVSFPGMY